MEWRFGHLMPMCSSMGEVIRPKQFWTEYRAMRMSAWRIAQRRLQDAGETVWAPNYDELFEQVYCELRERARRQREHARIGASSK
jgi:hypothetical protein